MTTPQPAALPEPTQEQLGTPAAHADYSLGWFNLGWALRMAERAASEPAALQPQPAAAVSDAEIIAIKKATKAADPTQPWGDTLAFARAILALQPQAMPMTWELLTDERIKSEDFNGMYWLALKNGTVTTGCYQWRQGHNPYGFNTEEQGRVIASDVSHIVPLAEPAHPGITAQGAQGGEG